MTEGVLAIFSQYVKNPFVGKDGKKLDANAVFESVNLVAQYLKQMSVKAALAAKKPFAAVKDFLPSLGTTLNDQLDWPLEFADLNGRS